MQYSGIDGYLIADAPVRCADLTSNPGRVRMVQTRFENVDIECWEHFANARFGRNPPFICLKGDAKASEVVLALLDELTELGPLNQRSMSLRTSHRSNACRKIRFILSPSSDTLNEMSITRVADTAIFEFTVEGLSRFRAGATRWRDGMDDFSIHPNLRNGKNKDILSGEVWFWTPLTGP